MGFWRARILGLEALPLRRGLGSGFSRQGSKDQGRVERGYGSRISNGTAQRTSGSVATT